MSTAALDDDLGQIGQPPPEREVVVMRGRSRGWVCMDRWYYNPDHGQICQIIGTQSLWGETTCRVWLPGSDTVVRVPVFGLRPLKSIGVARPLAEKADYAFAARRRAIERIGLPEVRNYRLNLLAQEERAFQEQHNTRAQPYPEMVLLLLIRGEGGQ